MCGIAGIVSGESRVGAGAAAVRLLDSLAHRGPDGSGWASFGAEGLPVAPCGDVRTLLAHRRLAILDLTPAGAQPMASPDGRFLVAFNGEIYNYLELARELEQLGHRFRSRSDTEVLLHAFMEWDTDAIRRFVGMFAFAIVDASRNRVVLARDGFGIKPLYYTTAGGSLAFASEIKALLTIPGVTRRGNAGRAFDYLRFGLTDHTSETMFEGIHQLPAGHWLEVGLDAATAGSPTRFWGMERGRREVSFEQAAEVVRELFLDSVRLHLRSDVPVGAALSGGVDSSAIVCAMRFVEGDSLDLHTFTYEADDPRIDETRWASLAAGATGAIRHTTSAQPGDIANLADDLVATHDEPVGSTSVLAQYRLFECARNAGIKVMLDGQGADELLGGYPRLIPARIASCLRNAHPAEGLALLRASSSGTRQHVSLAAKTAANLVPPGLHGAARMLSGSSKLMPGWLDARWFADRGVKPAAPWFSSGPEYLRSVLLDSVNATSLPMLLRYEDRNSMAHSVESRVPFLYAPLAEYALSLPESYLVSREGVTKSVFRRAMRGIVPDAILDRRDKIGFETPESRWLREQQPGIDRVLKDADPAQLAFLRSSDARELLSRRGPAALGQLPWRWLNFIRWTQRLGVTFA